MKGLDVEVEDVAAVEESAQNHQVHQMCGTVESGERKQKSQFITRADSIMTDHAFIYDACQDN
jgi:hypothetical protein